MRKNPHVRICGGPGSATTLVYPTEKFTPIAARLKCDATSSAWTRLRRNDYLQITVQEPWGDTRRRKRCSTSYLSTGCANE